MVCGARAATVAPLLLPVRAAGALPPISGSASPLIPFVGTLATPGAPVVVIRAASGARTMASVKNFGAFVVAPVAVLVSPAGATGTLLVVDTTGLGSPVVYLASVLAAGTPSSYEATRRARIGPFSSMAKSCCVLVFSLDSFHLLPLGV